MREEAFKIERTIQNLYLMDSYVRVIISTKNVFSNVIFLSQAKNLKDFPKVEKIKTQKHFLTCFYLYFKFLAHLYMISNKKIWVFDLKKQEIYAKPGQIPSEQAQDGA